MERQQIKKLLNETKQRTVPKTLRASEVFLFCATIILIMKRVGIIRGGRWDDYEASLTRGAEVFSFIDENLKEKWKPVDIFIDCKGVWHIGGLPILPIDLHHRVDMVWNTAGPEAGVILEGLNISHFGVPAFANALSTSRKILEDHMRRTDISMPMHLAIPAYQEDLDGNVEKYAAKHAKAVFEKFGSPWVVQSLSKENSTGVHVAKTFPDLVNAIIDGAEHGVAMMVEELITGEEVKTHSLTNFRDQDVYILPSLYKGKDLEKLHDIVNTLHNHTGAGYIHAHFTLHPRRGVILRNLEFSPDLKENSDLDQALKNVGIKPHNILESLLEKF